MIVFHRLKIETLSRGEQSPGTEQEKTREIKQNQDTKTLTPDSVPVNIGSKIATSQVVRQLPPPDDCISSILHSGESIIYQK
jgi:hypothetical protein